MRYIVRDREGTIYEGPDFKEAKRIFLDSLGRHGLEFESVDDREADL